MRNPTQTIPRLHRLSHVASIVLCLTLLAVGSIESAETTPPNVILIFIDDMGFADIGPFGANADITKNIDRLAAQGMRFTDFEVSSAVCSASRAALMTGCYHKRVGISGALGPQARIGINSNETTIAELCRDQGYVTACFGKWHLGHHPKFLPLQHGFDLYFGLPYSNDMWPLHPRFVDLPADSPLHSQNYPPLPLIQNNEVINANVSADDQQMLTTWYTERAVQFIDDNHDRPFFLYLPHSMVHVPLYVSEKFRGRSGRGLFADVVMEVDWSVGEIMKSLDQHGLSEQTIIIFTSDNGPWLSYGHHAGSAKPLREGKGTMFEGGTRVPTIMRWTGKIPPRSTCDKLASTIDILPTVAKLVGAPLPQYTLDGHDISALMFADPDARSPHEAFYFYYADGELQAIRDQRWKLHFPHRYRTLDRLGGRDGRPVNYRQATIGSALFDLQNDIAETHDVSGDQQEIVQHLHELAERARIELGDRLTNQSGQGTRPPGRLLDTDERLVW